MTEKPAPKPDQSAKPDANEKRHLDERLDEALEESFPASDVPAVHRVKQDKKT